ncbi:MULTISPECIES: NADH:flavin oxidoreductase/NADH oxidase [unclassified Frondihabitans]|uniref:NADH:flavin oxidoreductase/NADH oxidase n=1 Tax=unclassified Frondihabitans TaxID=2626248 RepID=UPI000F4E8847|nr:MULTISPECIES: NADH:flavin oxidoreductase/NADH oxidase [unclassified Frondihabitans]RPE74477.1 2,4-dienoyl-CoA reductase-like NADH-dependent reductase (Old Yellow Enzyme family) [Frondihabitans sp. PhB153]RPF02906.1 2,4-dienoyl-CoA reductase-like NADH-dependent reductase (Old Yellow Enzyme family) [Frondihabitans sp. PhB161]
MTSLFDPITLRGTTFRNRLWVPAMCQYSAENFDGMPGTWHLVHLGSFARGGAGAIITEATAVVPEGRISPQDLGIWNDAQRDAFRPIVDFVHSQGSAIGVQLAHAGRKASTPRTWDDQVGTLNESQHGWKTVGPSPIAFDGYDVPRELTTEEVRGVVQAFVDGAVRSQQAGFDFVELHAAHGYLMHEFLSPLSNQRTDEFGGSLENRARIVVDAVRGIRAATGDDFPILVRFSATDWTEGGWDEASTAIVSGWARDAGADLFDISSGGNVAKAEIPVGLGYQVPLAASVRADAEVETGAVGLIIGAEQAQAIVADGESDVVFVGREFLRDPHFALRVAAELGVDLPYYPQQYHRAPFHVSQPA